MTVLIVGGDCISSITKYLAQNGYDQIQHWDARRNGDTHRYMPQNTRLVVILINFLNHGMARKIKRNAEQLGVPVLFTANKAYKYIKLLRCCLSNHARSHCVIGRFIN
ncbi:DUF2325 domain-containing protein [Polynucleobacter necessarius]|uniref:DUF2325 domain-containing protein n=1 Tax=Polynucleobacter necessarius TaxID=576610 RepID=UPI000E09C32E